MYLEQDNRKKANFKTEQLHSLTYSQPLHLQLSELNQLLLKEKADSSLRWILPWAISPPTLGYKGVKKKKKPKQQKNKQIV